MNVRKEVNPFIAASVAAGVVAGVVCAALGASSLAASLAGTAVGLVLAAYMLYFFRDPERVAPPDERALVAGADGVIAQIVTVQEKEYIKAECVRISIFLSLFDVHVNRAPVGGAVKFLGYFPGKRFLTYKDKASEYNQHNSILIEGKTKCLVNQIVGPVCRRVVYWLELGQSLAKGDRIGMMKFGSRLDMYFPAQDVDVTVKLGDVVRAGVTEVARMKGGVRT
jgi:phosphatidylserine decarboxylase